MSRKVNYWDNAPMESFFATLKKWDTSDRPIYAFSRPELPFYPHHSRPRQLARS